MTTEERFDRIIDDLEKIVELLKSLGYSKEAGIIENHIVGIYWLTTKHGDEG